MEKQEMGNRRISVKIFNIITALFLAFSLTVPVHAMTEIESAGIDKNKAGSITVTKWDYDGTTFHLYKIADLNDDMQFVYTDVYKDVAKDIDISLENETELTADKWMQDANKLLEVIQKNNIQAEYTGQTFNGTCTFSNLQIGLYLLKGDKVKIGNKTVTSQPCLISVPNRVVVTDPWNYNITTEVKQADPEYDSNPASTPSASGTPDVSSSPESSALPGTSEVPSSSALPGTSEVPSSSASAGTSGSSESSTSTNTSDTSNLTFYVSVIAADVLIITLILFIRRKKTSKE